MITIPKGLVEAKNWKVGDLLEFSINKKGELLVKKAKR